MAWIRRHAAALVIVVLAIVAAVLYYPHSQPGRMANAERHIPILREALSRDPRFRSVQLEPFTGRGGSLLVTGTLASKAEQDALVTAVGQTNPPVEVVYSTSIASATRPSDSVVLHLDNHGGFANGGYRVFMHADGTCTWVTYSDAVGDEHTQRVSYSLNEAAGRLTVTLASERITLHRAVHDGTTYWLSDERLQKVGGPDDAEAWHGALREEPK